MKTYIEFANTLLFETTYIPKDITNSEYVRVLEEIKNGLATLKSFNLPSTWEKIRAQRNQLLIQSDWINMPDATPKPNKEAWLDYRQALRDIPSTFNSSESVIWPQKPA